MEGLNLRVYSAEEALLPSTSEKLRQLFALASNRRLGLDGCWLDDPLNFDAEGKQRWELTENGFVGEFKNMFLKVVTQLFSWVQPMIVIKAEPINDVGDEACGLVITLTSRGNMLLVANCEAGAKHLKVRPTIQTSFKKLHDVMAGDEKKDKVLAKFMTAVIADHGLREELARLEVQLSDAAHDTNKIEGEVAYGRLEVPEEILRHLAELLGGVIFSFAEVAEIAKCANKYCNPHLLVTRSLYAPFDGINQ